MTRESRALRDKAEEALEAARYTLEGGFLTTAINRAYYAAFYIAQAALLTVGEAPKTHAGVITRFSYHFVRTARLEASIAAILPYAEDLRAGADYDLSPAFDAQAIADLIADVDTFLEAVDSILQP